MRERKPSQPIIEVDARRRSTDEMTPPSREKLTSMAESHDDPSPRALTDLEREHFFNDLQEHSDTLKDHEKRIDDLEKNRSMPVTISGPKGLSITGSWRVVLALAILATIVSLFYLGIRYL
jgi:hypothetical protein